ncbi:hypothetical protein FJZ28_02545 [Candidatus Peregrinibacteria bacterium]|nr:hypothetical protein [Candidatus Peregrinibacteria bacterium]
MTERPPSVSLDGRQRLVQGSFLHLSSELDGISQFRVAEDNSLRCAKHICDSQAERDKKYIVGLKTKLTTIADDVPSMSTQRGDVYWSESDRLLDEELLRESHTDDLLRWRSEYRANRDSIANIVPDHCEITTPEEEVCRQAQDLLCTHLSDLSHDDEYQRAELILDQIQKRRMALLAQFAMSPLQSVRAVTMLTCFGIVALLNAIMVSVELGHFAFEYAINTPDILKQKRRLNVIQARCRTLLAEVQAMRNGTEFMEKLPMYTHYTQD